MKGKIIEFTPKAKPVDNVKVFEFEITNKQPCHHDRFEVDESARTVQCTTCGAWLDPFEVLLWLARKDGRLRYYEKCLKTVCEELQEKTAELNKLKQSVGYYTRKVKK